MRGTKAATAGCILVSMDPAFMEGEGKWNVSDTGMGTDDCPGEIWIAIDETRESVETSVLSDVKERRRKIDPGIGRQRNVSDLARTINVKRRGVSLQGRDAIVIEIERRSGTEKEKGIGRGREIRRERGKRTGREIGRKREKERGRKKGIGIITDRRRDLGVVLTKNGYRRKGRVEWRRVSA
jgi:hypothetical protein